MVQYHLVVLVHGLWGNSSHMGYIQNQIEEHIKPPLSDEKIIVYTTGSHSGFLTYDGIDINGKRVSDEILKETARLEDGKDKVVKFSIIGYSLGGLLSRYAIGILYSKRYFDEVEPVNFITFCSPHVGVLNPGSGVSIHFFNNLVPYLLAHTGSQLFLKDTKSVRLGDKQSGVPLLVWMTDPRSFFFKALAKFGHRSLYSNIINDKKTSWFTSAISVEDPFDSIHNENPGAYDLNYIKGYEQTIIDYTKPISYRDNTHSLKGVSLEKDSKLVNFFERKWNWLRIIGGLILYTPVWSLSFMITSFVERIKLNRRVNEFFRDTSNNLLDLYDYINDDINSVNEVHLPHGDALANDITSNYTSEKKSIFSSIEQDLSNQVDDRADALVESVFDAMNSEKLKTSYPGITNEKNYSGSYSYQPRLKLSPEQVKIIESLNSLEWDKYPILIRNTKASHAAAIVRHDDSNFDEGKVVINHLVTDVFQSD